MGIGLARRKAFAASIILILSLSVYGLSSEEKLTPKLSAKMKSASVTQELPVIVLFKEKDASFDIEYKGEIKKRYGLIDAAALRLTAKEIDKLKNNPKVERIYLDDIIKVEPISSSEKSTALGINIDAVGATYAQNTLGYTGKGITIAIVDSGIDYTHPDLGGCLGASCKVRGGYDFVNLDEDPMDDTWHGTHCAGIAAANGTIKGVAPDARLLAVKVLDSNGQGNNSNIIAGIDWAVANGADVISLSLGGSIKPSDGYYVLQLICDAAVKKGIVVVAAAGNEGTGQGTIADIASSINVIAVGAVDTHNTVSPTDDSLATFSSTGPASFGRLKPEITAPGVDISSTNAGGGYTTGGGTSMAAPHVSGAAALLLEHDNSLSPDQIKSVLMHSSTQISGGVFETGSGLINVTRAIQAGINASINNKAVWEDSVVPGMNKTAKLRIKNNKASSINLSISVSSLSDGEGGYTISSGQFSYASSLSLSPGEEEEVAVVFSANANDMPGTYGGTITVSGSGENLRIPIALTLPLFGGGVIQGSLDEECSSSSEEGCGISPVSVSEWGDWVFYKIKNSNGSDIAVNLTWATTLTDLDMYIYSPDGVLVNLSGAWNTNTEYAGINDPVYDEYWVGVYAYDLATSEVYFNLSVSYADSLRVEPMMWQGLLSANKTTALNFTLINDGTGDSGLTLSTVCLSNGASKYLTSTIAQTGSDVFYVVWKESTGGLDIDEARYLNASLKWNAPAKDLNLFFVYKDGTTWHTSGFESTHRSDVYGLGEEDFSMIDIKQFRESYSDVGIGISNPGTSQAYNLTLNFTDEDACTYASTSPTSISTLYAGQERTIQVSVDTASLLPGKAYDSSLIILDDGQEIARVPISFELGDAAGSTSTSTTTSTTTTSTSTTTSTQASGNEETVEINPGHHYYYRQWTNEVSENTTFTLSGLGYDLGSVRDAILQLKQVNASDASLPEHSDVVYPYCASNTGGTADLYFNGQRLVTFTSGTDGIDDNDWSDGSGGYFGQWYCCGCSYTHNITLLLSETNNLYFQQHYVAATGYTKITQINLILLVSDSNETVCDLEGDEAPCGEVTLSEVIAAVNDWSSGGISLSSVIALINAWTEA